MITIYINEITRILQKNLRIIILNIIGFSSMIVLIGLSVSYYTERADCSRKLNESYGGRTFYKILYDGDISDLYNRIYSTDSIENVKNAFDELSDASLFEYHYSDVQTVCFTDKYDVGYAPSFVHGYETGYADDENEYVCLKAVYADRLFFQGDNITLAEGRSFGDNEYLFVQGQNLPVVLGADYCAFYSIGDIIQNASLWDETAFSLQVVGFLERDSSFYDNNNEQVILNRYMIIPGVEISDTTDCPNSFTVGAYSGTKLMNARIVCRKGSEKAVTDTVNAILNENGLYDFYLFDETAGAERIVTQSKEFTWIGFLTAALSLVVCTAMLILGAFSRILAEIKNYGIYMLIGFSKRRIFVFSILETLMIFIPANIISLCAFLWMYTSGFDEGIFNPIIIISALLTEIFAAAVSAAITAYRIHTVGLSSTIRQKD